MRTICTAHVKVVTNRADRLKRLERLKAPDDVIATEIYLIRQALDELEKHLKGEVA